MQRRVLTAAAAVAMGLIASNSQAAEIYWQGGTGNLTDANYTDGTTNNLTPLAGDILDLGENGIIGHSTSLGVGRVRVGHNLTGGQPTGGDPGSATLNMTAGTLTLGGNSTLGGAGLGAGLVVGYNANGTFNLSGGSVTVTRHVVVGQGGVAAGTGTLNLSGTASLRSTLETLRVGNGNAGDLTVADSATLFVIPSSLAAADNPDLWIGSSTASTFTQSGGTTYVANSFLIESGSTVTLSGGTLHTKYKVAANGYTGTPAPAGNIQIGRGGSVGDTLNISGSAVVNVGNRFLLGSSGAGGIDTEVNQSGGTVNSVLSFVVSDTGGNSTYNLSGGTLNVANELSRVGRRGDGTMIQTGGIANFNAGLAIGDDADTGVGETSTATGLYEISNGELHASTSSLSQPALGIGSAGNGSGTNATADASGAVGTFRVIGDDGLIDVNGDFRAANVEGAGTLAFELESGDILSVIDVSGIARFDAGSILVFDTSNAAPTQSVYDLLTASDVIDNGISFSGPAGWSYQIVSGGNGEILQVVVPEPGTIGMMAMAGLLALRRRRA